MKRLIPAALLLGAPACVIALAVLTGPPPGRADEPRARSSGSTPAAATVARGSASPRDSDETKRLLEEAKNAIRRGDYRGALQAIEAALSIAPDHPWAQLYRSLCERRLKAPSVFAPLSPGELGALQQNLHQEERAQRRAAVQQKTAERLIRKEQARWDQELGLLQREAERQEQLKRRQAQADAVARAREEHARQRARLGDSERRAGEDAVRGTAEPPAPPAEPAPAARPVPSGPRPPVPIAAGPGAVQLSPVVVPAGEAPERPAGPAVSPSLVGRALPPPGAVQINARQMHVEPNRKLAIADGDVEVTYGNAFLTCDHLTLFTDTKDVYAEGRVRLEEGNQVFRGEMVHYNFNTKKGRFLQGTVSNPPWHEHGRSVEHLAEGVYEVQPGYLTSCELEPPHFRFQSSRAIVFGDDKVARGRHVTLVVEQFPFIYLPWISVADRQTPFFIIPGKKKPWEQFALMGYRYTLPNDQHGTLHLDWRRAFAWGFGLDHQFNNKPLGKGLLRLYYNQEHNMRRPEDELPKGAGDNRYRVLWRHDWRPMLDTNVITNIQEFSDVDFRKEFLFRDEFVKDDLPESFVSVVKSTKDFSLTGLIRKRMNRFESVTETFPQLTFDTGDKRIGETYAFSQTLFDVANFQSRTAHSDKDEDVVRVDWFQQLRYALNLFRPIEVTPRAGIRQTYHTKDIQGGVERPHGNRDVFSGQFSAGIDASLKLFRVFPVVSNALGLDLHWLRHVLTPTLAYAYVHQPTAPNRLFNFGAAQGHGNTLTFGLENKLQTRRRVGGGKTLQGVDVARFLMSIPYTFRGNANKPGGRLGDWTMDLEVFPWPWMRLETNWNVPSHFVKGTRDDRITTWNLDLVMVGGRGERQADEAHDIQAPRREAFEPGPRGGLEFLIPQGQWYLGLGHRYQQNNKTEGVLEFDWRPSAKWQIGTFHRLTWKEVAGGGKRFGNVRERQYSFRRDLHDWVAELVYRVDREFGEELFFIMTLKAYPDIPIEINESYHQPKIGSQSSPFSPVGR